MYYVGLTDDPNRRWVEHGRPRDWRQFEFGSEAQARAWERGQLARSDVKGGPGGGGWRYGYFYTVTSTTVE
jgi:hypothetical protein